ncbi:TetR/AcrR family transcriptional regulator [Methyloradius palustris]|uniref:TetR family transcriptional regulator n=1 Tax=Methyloradius palustris TaxID=2778876 RepID=A0A8D5K046_9PROT|nr:TetR/AcrR family transcriptional regulator [Methyloradius palustris]BCM26292.1 TetR family transcriptional regulator [Methyloradius palustris]
METTKTQKPLGRPRKFDKDVALENALQLFRRKGYEATSMTDITEALGINRPSVYAAFGNKETLFSQVLAKYVEGPTAYLDEVLFEKTSREVVRQLLIQSVDLLTSLEKSTGCLAVLSSVSSELESVGIQQKIIDSLHRYEKKLAKRFDQAINEGDLPEGSNSESLSKYVTTVHKGLSVQASNGASKEELYGVVEVLLQSWPGK